jgi:Amt family ammonium transporter
MNLKKNLKSVQPDPGKKMLAIQWLLAMKGKAGAILLIMLSSLLFSSSSVFGQDPSGANTGTIKDLGIDTIALSKDSTVNTVISAVNTIGNADGHNKIAINIVWTLIAGFLVMFMQAGFALVETGFTQKKNVAHTMAMNFLIYVLGLIGFWICGFAFMFGGGLNVAALGGSAGVVSHEFSVHLFGHDFDCARPDIF